MSTLKYNTLKIKGLRDVLTQISNACSELEIDYFIVGALARNVWFTQNNLPARGTRDIVCAFYLPNEEKYNDLRELLQKKHSYTESSTNAFCFITPAGQAVDLLPFGEIEHDGKVMIEGQGLTSINLDGFQEVFNNGKESVTIGDETYFTCSIPGVVILKLIAYDDRPEQRMKDVKDINEICQHYQIIEQEDIWEHHNDLFAMEVDNFDVGMQALGREMKKLVFKNEGLSKRISNIINKALTQETPFLSLMIQNSIEETLDMKTKIIMNIQQGFLEDYK